jgi:hypothetical protein
MSKQGGSKRQDTAPVRDSRRGRGKAAGAAGPMNRRSFLGAAGGVATAAASVALDSLLYPTSAGPVSAQEVTGPLPGSAETASSQRRNRSAAIRHNAESFNRRLPIPEPLTNGDEERYTSRIGNYSKGLPHDDLGEVDPAAYAELLLALGTKHPADFERITMGCPDAAGQRKLVNPLSGVAFDLQGSDSHQFAMRPAPALASAEAAGEATELYWMALLRDVSFLDYDVNADAQAAAAELSALSDFRGPRTGGQVTTRTLFRDDLPGSLTGPYVSQFLWLDTPFGAEFVERRMRTLLPGIDYATVFSEWLDLQRGCPPAQTDQFDPVRRYIRNGRDLAQWVRIDVLFQAYFNAMLILLGMGAPLSPANPYHGSQTMHGFGTFGGPHAATITCEPATRALKAVWYQKWFVHRRLRPEAFGGRVHNTLAGVADYPLHPDVLNSEAVSRVFSKYGSHLLPQAFTEGSPLHPSFGAGHATVAGACVTMVKAMFDESFVIPHPVVPTPDGTNLVPYSGPDLTVGGELNKLASNVATGRNIAGIHWRTDGFESLKLGEAVAISILRDQRETFKEGFGGFTFTKFDGTTITV